MTFLDDQLNSKENDNGVLSRPTTIMEFAPTSRPLSSEELIDEANGITNPISSWAYTKTL